MLVSNEDILFNDTLEYNINLGRKVSKSFIFELAKKINFYDFIVTLSEGLDETIAEGGRNLSTGQRKKILILRAFVSKAEIVFFDEVLSGLDEKSRMCIEQEINNSDKTCLIISHEETKYIDFTKKMKLENGTLQEL